MMRRFTLSMAMAALVSLVPNLAWAGDQEVAQQIAQSLRDSGRLVDYSIGVKYQEGTAWLMGRVANQEQLQEAVNLASQLPYVNHVESQLEIQPTRAQQEQPQQQNGFQRLVSRLTGNDDQVKQVSYPQLVGPVQNAGAVNFNQPTRQTSSRNSQAKAVSRDDMLFGNSVPVQYQAASNRQPIPGDPLVTGRQVAHTQQEPQAMAQPQQARPVSSANTAAAGHGHGGHGQAYGGQGGYGPMVAGGAGVPAYGPTMQASAVASYDSAHMPCYAWPSYAAYPNYAGVTYPTQYSATAWPYIGPFYPYPQVPLGWRKVTLEWDDGWWFLSFDDKRSRHPFHQQLHHAHW